MKLPCEIMIWKVLPALKARISKVLRDRGLSQTEIAKSLGVTPAAVSQYLKGKRGTDYKVPKEMNEMIEVVATSIEKGNNKKLVVFGLCQLCQEIRKRKLSCDLCRAEAGTPEDCTICGTSLTLE